jgi:hypothetical protein
VPGSSKFFSCGLPIVLFCCGAGGAGAGAAGVVVCAETPTLAKPSAPIIICRVVLIMKIRESV